MYFTVVLNICPIPVVFRSFVDEMTFLFNLLPIFPAYIAPAEFGN